VFSGHFGLFGPEKRGWAAFSLPSEARSEAATKASSPLGGKATEAGARQRNGNKRLILGGKHLGSAIEPRQNVYAQRFEHAPRVLLSRGEATSAVLK